MAPTPDVIVVARHGARLDAADKSWHLTSPAPYDPPLTYGGWTQSKALGTRIASILHNREQEQEVQLQRDSAVAEDRNGGQPKSLLDVPNTQPKPTASRIKKKRRKIILHTSPFLRCVQTAIGISAGFAHFNGSQNKLRISKTPSRPSTPLPGYEPEDNPFAGKVPPKIPPASELPPGAGHPKLRIDAFLGEWLSPDYYDLITPPPNSTMMVAGAKADLIRRAEYVEVHQAANLNMGNFPGGWGSSSRGRTNSPTTDPDPFARLGSLAQALPHRDRSSSHGSFPMRSAVRPATSNGVDEKGAYIAPTPNYAVAPTDPIPRGYVAHARDGCTDIDFGWDSMREPLNWPDGGEYGEEWSVMHKRFRQGLNDMITWYKEHGTQPQSHEWLVLLDDGEEPDDDENTEVVLILVSHAAGCNALIGALTNQPVLTDVAMGSLSMAVRKDNVSEQIQGKNSVPNEGNRPSLDTSNIANQYDMRLVASADHLRPGVDPSRLDNISSPRIVPKAAGETRAHRFSTTQVAAGSSLDLPLNIGEPRQSAMAAALGSVRRSQSGRTQSNSPQRQKFTTPITTSYIPRTSTPPSSAVSSTGLWSSPVSAKPSSGHETSRSMSDITPAVTSQTTPCKTTEKKTVKILEQKPVTDEHHDENDDVHELRPASIRTSSGNGASLWGAGGSNGDGKPWGAAEKTIRERGPKRRWTVIEREEMPGE